MNTEQAKQATTEGGIITYTPKDTRYVILGKGKGKLENGDWFEGLAYIGNDNVVYVRPYHLFNDFNLI